MEDFGEKPTQFANSEGKTDQQFDLSGTAEGIAIKERLEKEFNWRMSVLSETLDSLNISTDMVVVSPPVLDRTDFGYVGGVDFIFLGSESRRDALFKKLNATEGLFPHIISYDSERLEWVKKEIPELYDFIMQRKGNLFGQIKGDVSESNGGNFLKDIDNLEARAKAILNSEEKKVLKEQRMKIGLEFITEVKHKVNVIAHAFSGSMINNQDRFGINSDLDIDLLINAESETTEKVSFE